MSKLTERERWLMTEAFMRGYEWGHDDTVTKHYMTRTTRTSELCREWLDTQSQVGATFGQALADMAPKPAPIWQPIETAPKDGTLIDVWCVPPGDSDFEPEKGGIRLTSIHWREADEIFPHTGWIRVCDNGDFDLVDGVVQGESEFYLPPWIPTHWMPLPEGPAP